MKSVTLWRRHAVEHIARRAAQNQRQSRTAPSQPPARPVASSHSEQARSRPRKKRSAAARATAFRNRRAVRMRRRDWWCAPDSTSPGISTRSEPGCRKFFAPRTCWLGPRPARRAREMQGRTSPSALIAQTSGLRAPVPGARLARFLRARRRSVRRPSDMSALSPTCVE